MKSKSGFYKLQDFDNLSSPPYDYDTGHVVEHNLYYPLEDIFSQLERYIFNETHLFIIKEGKHAI